MNIRLLSRAVDLFAKLAASPELMQLREPLGGKLYSNLWFGNRMAETPSDMKNFAIFDNKIRQAIRSLESNYGVVGGSSDKDINKFYLSHPKTQELIQFICDSYNRKFSGINANDVLNHLESNDSLDSNPIFILIHDLIHQVIEYDFVKQLETQEDDEGDGVITLMDQLNEDLSSSLSGFQPSAKKNVGQGLAAYIKNIFSKNISSNFYKLEHEPAQKELETAIDNTFHIAKAELRGKLEKIKSNLPESYVSKTKPIPPKVKQLVDGILSKLKQAMKENIDQVINSRDDIGYRGYYQDIWEAFELQDIFDEYNQKIIESSVIEQADSSALRSWMIECLGKMKELLNYFETEFEEELQSEYDDEEDED